MKAAICAAVLVAPVLAGICRAADPPPPPCAGEFRQFDFWIGEWNVTVGGKPAGTNRIERILDGCALLENWTGAQGGAGKSLNFFDRDDGLWHQTWIDARCGALFLAGKFAAGVMRLEGESAARQGKPAMRQRITWTPLADGKVRQLWESAPLDSVEWSVQFDGLYSPSQ